MPERRVWTKGGMRGLFGAADGEASLRALAKADD
jgi:hypothetical protein